MVLSRRYEKTHAPYCPFKSKNLFSDCRNIFGWFGEVGGMRKNYTHRCATSFFVAHRWKVRKPKSFFDFLTLVIRHWFFFFVPETQHLSFFFEHIKRRAPKDDRDLSFPKFIWSHVMPFGVKSDRSFWAQKQRIRVRVSSFGTAGTVVWRRAILEDRLLAARLG